ncbi:calcineurin-like phosphoesterase family protein [Sinobacterium caligoides]|uniref:Calcineurin-like phosphoesterase family protein n=1 Tax=Sinobacterium caligoides TaxID=933926 RepID=A0A3N2E078_9GAMM|nr:DNRLRE domain-containing protein [Sinobacterium caligoides]ROS05500.1 calcineurin-like phosphoesterase family protein [Sinobacterium caligoides]
MNKKVLSLAVAGLITASTSVLADSQWVRLGWANNASNEATVSFTAKGENNNPYLKYGYSTNESDWLTEAVTFNTTMASITSKHVRLSNLQADASVYFRVCDDSGCGDRFWFKTAADDNSPFVFVAGGDTRSGTSDRQAGNRLVAKVRPLFVMHGGDFTNSNNNSQWQQWLTDWELTYSKDVINNIDYKRIYPLVSTHGNHEDGDISTICKMLGVDPNHSNDCSAKDTYYATSISPLLRVYTLNSQFMSQSTSLKNAQNDWLKNDLAENGSSASWRFAQYHKPMFPHYTGKSDNKTLFDWWAKVFFDYAVNVVVESDTHLTKITEILEPQGDGFAGVDEGVSAGTIYVGEGSWGAPARSANDAKSWTIDLASIQQFKVISVSEDTVSVRTAQFDSSASTLTKAERDADATALPANINWWQPNQVGEVLALKRNALQKTVMANGDGGDNGATTISLLATADTFISSKKSTSNYGSSDEQLLSDGSDSSYGIMDTLIKWDLSSVPSCAEVISAKVELNVFNSSSGTYGLYAGVNSWEESSATWSLVNGEAQQGAGIGSFTPSSKGHYSVNLNSNGVGLAEGWIEGDNNGIVISSTGTTNGIDFNDRESGNGPKLTISYNADQCTSE